jgi:predicted nucleic-acid-binding protein
MTRCFIDTNIWLRTILKDNEQFQECVKFIETISRPPFKSYTSTIVLLEIDYLLTRTFKVSKSKSYIRLNALTQIPGLTIIDQTDYLLALKLYHQTNIKFADCLIATQIPKDVILVTYDREFRKIKGAKVLTPGQFLQYQRSKN